MLKFLEMQDGIREVYRDINGEPFIEMSPGYIDQERIHMVFCLIYCRQTQPFTNYSLAVKKGYSKMVVPQVLVQNRWDGLMGFPGGMCERYDFVDEIITREGLELALFREVKEEIGFTINPNNLELNSTYHYVNRKRAIHSFSYEVDYDTMKDITRTYLVGSDAEGEVNGLMMVPLIDYNIGGGISNFLQSPFKATAQMELLALKKKVVGA